MKNKIWKKSSLLPISVITLVAGIILACADIDMPDYPNSLFAPEVIQNDKYAPFFRSFYPLYQGSYKEDDSYLTDFNNINITEWQGYFQNHVRDQDLRYILYKARLGEIDTLIFSIKKPGYPINNILKSNSVLKVSDTRSALDFLYYMGFAKRCEKYSTYLSAWSDEGLSQDKEDPRKDKLGITTLEDGGIKQITNTKSDFVRQRYAFQVLRLYFMGRDYDKVIQFYTAQKSTIELTANSIKYRCIGYLAGAYCKEKQYSTANYLYSQYYDQYDSLKVTAYFSFKPQEEKDWQQTLAMAKNTREKTVLWHMLGMYYDPFRALKEIYALDPKSDLLDLMLTRSVNIEEEGFLDQAMEEDFMNTADSISFIKTKNIDKEMVNFIKGIADKGNTSKPYEWDLAAGYLEWTLGDNSFIKYLEKAKSECGSISLVLEQVRLIKLLDQIKQGKAGDKKFEESVVPELVWLKGENNSDGFRQSFAHQFVLGALVLKYTSAGDIVKSTCLRGLLNEAATMNNGLLNSIETYINKKDKTAFDSYVLSEFPYSKADMVEVQAVNLMYKHKYKEALTKLNEADTAGNGKLSADPFLIHINDNHDSDASLQNNTAYTKKSFLQKMVDLEAKATSDPAHAADTYFQLANGYYNISYFGNNRVFYDTRAASMNNVDFSFRNEYNTTLNKDTMPDYMSSAIAEEYYNKAMGASKDPEFKAKCCFMAAKCEQNTFFCHEPKDYKGDFKAGKYFTMLKSNYSATKYYREIIEECGYFKTYLGL